MMKALLKHKKNRIDISKYKEDIIRIENNIESAIASSQSRISAGYLSDIYTLRTTIQTQMDIRTGIWINENSESSDSLASQRRTYQTQLTNSTESLRAPESGILVLSCDENEEKFTYNGVGDITEDDIKDTYNINYLSKTTAVEAGSPVFKIITNSNWKLCAYIDSSVASEWNTGDVKIIRATVNKEDISVEMTIDSMTVKEDNTYVVFKTSNSIQDFLSARSVDFYIIDSTYEGLKIPNTAIIEKTFIKIPSSCIAESLNGKSVVKRTNGKDEVVGIQVAYDDEQFSYVRQDFDVIKIGDVLVSGSGEGAAECRLSEVATRVGVLTANGAYTKFAAISVMGQNSQYTIADPSGSVLKAYDKIISNASGINEGDEIY
ncbi:hypothetical protein IMSAG049_00654 [Clostridiales bacterium]|nr:hypothetical protein IMSAG049_00654 [Clostridiales bacterium]